jgi:hypothetical protein
MNTFHLPSLSGKIINKVLERESDGSVSPTEKSTEGLNISETTQHFCNIPFCGRQISARI